MQVYKVIGLILTINAPVI